MSRFTSLLVLARDFKKNTDKFLIELAAFENQFDSRESEITTLTNQVAVVKNQKEILEAESKVILDTARREAEKIVAQAESQRLIVQSVTMKAAQDKEEADRMMAQAKAMKAQVEFDRADLDRQAAAFRDKQNRLQEVLK